MDNETLEIVKAEAERIRYTHAFELKQHAFRVAANEARIENLMNRRDMLAADGCVMACRHADVEAKLTAVLAAGNGVAV